MGHFQDYWGFGRMGHPRENRWRYQKRHLRKNKMLINFTSGLVCCSYFVSCIVSVHSVNSVAGGYKGKWFMMGWLGSLTMLALVRQYLCDVP